MWARILKFSNFSSTFQGGGSILPIVRCKIKQLHPVYIETPYTLRQHTGIVMCIFGANPTFFFYYY